MAIYMTHLKRHNMPNYWPVETKTKKWAVSPLPGPHAKYRCIPLQVILRDVLKVAETAAEAKSILSSGKVLVDGRVRKETRYPIGFMDILEVPDIGKRYIIDISKNGLFVTEAGKGSTKICRIEGKVKIRGGKTQLNLHDGRNIIVGEKENYRVGDSITIEIPSQKIVGHHPLKEGANAIIIYGKNMGTKGIIKEIKNRKTFALKNTITIDSGGKRVETFKDYVFVLSGGRGR